MVLVEADKGTPTIDSSVVDLFASVVATQHSGVDLFFDNLTSGDSFQITIFRNDSNSATEKIYDQFTMFGVQSRPNVFIPFLPNTSFRVTAQKLTGTDRIIDWIRWEDT